MGEWKLYRVEGRHAMPRGARVKIASIPEPILRPYLAGEIGYREVARRLGMPRNTTLRALARLGHVAARAAVDVQGRASRERWLPVPVDGYGEDYLVSDRGRVKRVDKGRCLAPHPSDGGAGWPIVVLSVRGRTRAVLVCRLVAGAFLGPAPRPSAVVRYRDGDDRNCAAANLYWGDRDRKLSPEQAEDLRTWRGRESSRKVAARFGVSFATVLKIWSGKTYKD